MEYIILEANYSGHLEEQVDKYLKLGWELQGGVAILFRAGLENTDDRFYYAQAMTKK